MIFRSSNDKDTICHWHGHVENSWHVLLFIKLFELLAEFSHAKKIGRGGGLVVSVHAFYSDDPSSNPAGYLNFLYEKTKINKKEAGEGPSFKKLA